VRSDLAYVQIQATVVSSTLLGPGGSNHMAGGGPIELRAAKRLSVIVDDGTGQMEMVFFKGIKWNYDRLKPGSAFLFFGKPSDFNGRLNMVHPEIDNPVIGGPDAKGTLTGVYPSTEKLKNAGITGKVMCKLQATALSACLPEVKETLPDYVLKENALVPLTYALRNIHFPADSYALQKSVRRLKFEELFYLQLALLKQKYIQSRGSVGLPIVKVGAAFNACFNALPYELTGAQKRVIREIRNDTGSGHQMNRLLQGDVGSGKTIVAFLSMLIALDNGYQACIMAPTEILATQHYESLSAMAQHIGVKVALLTGSTRKKAREAIHEQLRSGELQILIGTHALIEEEVKFRNLGLAVIDEQHRFGVAQRAKLWKKNVSPPHVLVMTATPIPRTLAMTVYGDLDVSVIDELPPGRKPVTTRLRYENQRQEMYHFIGTELRKGRQAYIVYPLIEESEKLDLKALEEGYEIVRETFPHYRVCYVHGRMKPAEKDHQMQLFASGQANILVATTVIEVGVNVPNASVMVIENAERFGLSQLHQLRGRVGRGADQSYCILMSKHELSKDTRHRLEVMTQTNDGFVVAEEDMKLRGPGDMEGTQQSGIAFNLRISNLATDGLIVQAARDDAQQILDADPDLTTPQGRRLDAELRTRFNRTQHWGLIS
jgi:ATP-dependent DNA helicase RecG